MSDPPRLRSSSALGLLLDEARTEKLDDEARARAWRSIEAATSTGAAAGTAKSGSLLGKLRALSLTKLGIASLALVLAGGSLAVIARRPPSPVPASPSPSSPIAEAAPPVAEAAARTAAATPEITPAPTPLPEPRTSSAPARPLAPSPPPAKSALPLEEGRLLLEAKAATSADPGRALALTATHARAFPSSALGAERESIAVEALARLGRCDEARARAQRFLTIFPASPHRTLVARLEARCGS